MEVGAFEMHEFGEVIECDIIRLGNKQPDCLVVVDDTAVMCWGKTGEHGLHVCKVGSKFFPSIVAEDKQHGSEEEVGSNCV